MWKLTTFFLLMGGIGATYCWLARRQPSPSADPHDAPGVIDEALIAASPDVVFRAVVDEHNGTTDWWAPHYSMELLDGDSYGIVGTLVANTVRIHGKYPIKFNTRTVEVDPNRLIRVEYVNGAFRGEALWTFDERDGKTLLSNRWSTIPAGVLRAMAPFLPVNRSHSETMRAGFENLARYLDQTVPALESSSDS